MNCVYIIFLYTKSHSWMHFKLHTFKQLNYLKEECRFAKKFCDVYKSNYKLAEIS